MRAARTPSVGYGAAVEAGSRAADRAGRPAARSGSSTPGIAKLLGLATGGQPPHIFTTLARNRGLFRRWLWFAGGLMPGGKLPRARHRAGDPPRRPQHRLRVRVGPPRAARPRRRAQRRGDRAGREAPRRPAGRRARRCCCAPPTSCTPTGRIGDELWGELAASSTRSRLIELCLLIGHYEMLAMTLNTLRVQPDPRADRARLPRWRSRA